MNWNVVTVGLFLILLRCLFPPTAVMTASAATVLTSQILELGIFTFALGYVTRPTDSGDPLYFIRRHLHRQTEKYLLVGVSTLCVAILPAILAPWFPGGGTPLSLMMIFTFPVGSGGVILYALYHLITNGSTAPLLVLVPWILVIGLPSLIFLLALAAR